MKFISFKYTDYEKYKKAREDVSEGSIIRLQTRFGVIEGTVQIINERGIEIDQYKTGKREVLWVYIDSLTIIEGDE